MWYGDYYGVMSFEVNTKVVTNVPKDWADLLKPEYKNMVALAGDPTASNQATSGRLGLGLRRRRRPRQRRAGPRLLQEAQRREELRAGHRQRHDRRLG